MTTTTESQITSGKAESIDTAEFGLLLAKVELAATKIDHAQRDAPEYEAAFQRLITHIEAVREKDSQYWFKEGLERAQLLWDEEKMNLESDRDHFKAIAERQAADNETHNFEICMKFDNWLLEKGALITPHSEDVDGPMAPALNWIASVEALLSPAQQEPSKAHEFFNDLPNEISTKEANATDAGYKPEHKMLTDHHGRVIGVQWINAADAPPVGAAQATPEGGQELPPLPPMKLTIAGEPGRGHYYTADQMRDYARAAYALGRAAPLQQAEEIELTDEWFLTIAEKVHADDNPGDWGDFDYECYGRAVLAAANQEFSSLRFKISDVPVDTGSSYHPLQQGDGNNEAKKD